MDYRSRHTFVVCAYGESPYLEACIQSLKAQTVTSQIILYTSTRNSQIEALCQAYGLPLFTGQGGGIGADWNQALSFVQTPFATLAHQDDVYLPTYLEAVMAELDKRADHLIVYTDYFEEKNGARIESNTNLKIKRLMLATLNLLPKSRFWRRRVLAFGNPICCPAVTYHLAKLGDFRFSETMRTSLDWKAWYEISGMSGRFGYVADGLMLHRIHEASETSQTIADNTRTQEDLEVYQLFWPSFVARLINRFYVKSQASNQ